MSDYSHHDGVDLIAEERIRQVEAEGYTAEHDAGHALQLVAAAKEYVMAGELQARSPGAVLEPGVLVLDDHMGTSNWPWDASFYKPGPDAIRTLTKAGALIAAAIDSLIAEAPVGSTCPVCRDGSSGDFPCAACGTSGTASSDRRTDS